MSNGGTHRAKSYDALEGEAEPLRDRLQEAAYDRLGRTRRCRSGICSAETWRSADQTLINLLPGGVRLYEEAIVDALGGGSSGEHPTRRPTDGR